MKRVQSVAILITCFGLSSIYAAQFYRHIPFTITMKKADVLIVDYDFTEKKSIHCISINSKTNKPANTTISFSYKGHAKSALLPVTLETDHVPDKNHEELANISDQFTIKSAENAHDSLYEVSCTYTQDAL